MIDLDGPPPCYACGKPVTVHEYCEDDYTGAEQRGWWWECPTCEANNYEVSKVRPSYRTFPATAALAAELMELRARLAAGGDRVA